MVVESDGPGNMTNETSGELGRDTIRVVQHRDHLSALGAASLLLSQAKPFYDLSFGHWIDTVNGQILRGHYFFSLLSNRLVGYCGYALTSQESAQDWIHNRRVLSLEECQNGPCVLVMAVRAIGAGVYQHQARVIRSLLSDHEVCYWKRLSVGGVRIISFPLQARGVRRKPNLYRVEQIG